MKKIISILLCVMMIFGMAACGSKEEASSSESKTEAVSAEESSLPGNNRYEYRGISINLPDGFYVKDAEPLIAYPADYPTTTDNICFTYESGISIKNLTESYLLALLQSVYNDIEKFNEFEKIKIGDLDVLYFSYDITYSGVGMNLIQCCIDADEGYVCITFTDISGTAKEMFQKSIDSIISISNNN